MWFYVAALIILFFIVLFYRARQESPEVGTGVGKTPESPGKPERPEPETQETPKGRNTTEVSSEIGVPLEAIDAERAGQIDRLSGVARSRVRPDEGMLLSKGNKDRETSSREARKSDSGLPYDGHLYKSQGSPRERKLRKDNLSKEVELALEAGELIELQPGAWARHKDFPELMVNIPAAEPKEPSPAKIPPGERLAHEGPYFLPDKYGIPRLVLMARDPEWIFAYWELTHEKYKELYEKHLKEWALSRPVLRLYDMTPGILGEKVLDIPINDEANNWYINLHRPRHTLFAELGRLFPTGFVALLRSNRVTLPPDDFSELVSEEWEPLVCESFRYKTGTSSPWIWGKA